MSLNLRILEGQFTIHRFPPKEKIPTSIFEALFLSISRTDEELSIVCPASIDLDSPQAEADWSCIKVLGPLDFTLTGILADLATVLAEAKISIFAISTFDTDYLMVKSDRLRQAKEALEQAGYTFNPRLEYFGQKG